MSCDKTAIESFSLFYIILSNETRININGNQPCDKNSEVTLQILFKKTEAML